MRKNLFAISMVAVLLLAFTAVASAAEPLDLSGIEPTFTQIFTSDIGTSHTGKAIPELDTDRITLAGDYYLIGDGYYYPHNTSSSLTFTSSFYDFALEYDYYYNPPEVNNYRVHLVCNGGNEIYDEVPLNDAGTGVFRVSKSFGGSHNMADCEFSMLKGNEYTIRVEKVGASFVVYGKAKGSPDSAYAKIGSSSKGNSIATSTFTPSFRKANADGKNVGYGNIKFWDLTSGESAADVVAQKKDNTVRFASALDSLDLNLYVEAGFEITYGTKTEKFVSTQIFKAMQAGEDVVSASDITDGCDYIFTVALKDIPVEEQGEIIVVPYLVDLEGNTVAGTSSKFSLAELN